MVIKGRILAAICSLTLCCLMCGCGSNQEELLFIGETESQGEERSDKTEAPEAEEAVIQVYVCGAVQNPGVVSLPEGSRAEAALEAAGGFGGEAATDYVNLAAKLMDGEKLYFPTVGECAAAVAEERGLVNINTADAALLCTLPGIGEARAADIIRYRETYGLFESCEDIMSVSGIKTSVYEKMKDFITVE